MAAREAEMPESGTKGTGPMRDIVGTFARFMSLVSVEDAGVFTGACEGDPPRSTARSTVRNGAVNGTSARTIRQHAVIRDNMTTVAGRGSKSRATLTIARQSR